MLRFWLLDFEGNSPLKKRFIPPKRIPCKTCAAAIERNPPSLQTYCVQNMPKNLPLLPHPSNTTRRVNLSRIPPLKNIRSHGSEESSHAASDNGLEISMLLKVDRDPLEFNRQSTSLHGDRSTHESIRPTPKTLLNQDNSQFIHGYSSFVGSDSSSMMMM
ncbi:hypothetical protein VNO77_07617 [Canavalia gladiata]|uniref:Uncharacterized protein n=1 Tax=Canavalia gladiata TaxID=3824 RepID=A0AAN9MEI1_CANGL